MEPGPYLALSPWSSSSELQSDMSALLPPHCYELTWPGLCAAPSCHPWACSPCLALRLWDWTLNGETPALFFVSSCSCPSSLLLGEWPASPCRSMLLPLLMEFINKLALNLPHSVLRCTCRYTVGTKIFLVLLILSIQSQQLPFMAFRKKRREKSVKGFN